jgi:hypothetical protein
MMNQSMHVPVSDKREMLVIRNNGSAHLRITRQDRLTEEVPGEWRSICLSAMRLILVNRLESNVGGPAEVKVLELTKPETFPSENLDYSANQLYIYM